MQDRNFDDLAAKFAAKIYASQKGAVRMVVIWRDLLECCAQRGVALQAEDATTSPAQPLRVLELGGGLGQFSCRLAQLGHRVVYNDISATMAEQAQQRAAAAGCLEVIEWRIGSYQQLVETAHADAQQFDLILCHAMIEWLAKPSQLVAQITPLLAPNGLLSLSYYNHHGWAYRNLLRGNFNLLSRPYQSHPGSLTPQHAFSFEQIEQWLRAAQLRVHRCSGIRVFSDYTREQRGGLQSAAATLEQELNYSVLEPYKWLGRYLHVVAERDPG